MEDAPWPYHFTIEWHKRAKKKSKSEVRSLRTKNKKKIQVKAHTWSFLAVAKLWNVSIKNLWELRSFLVYICAVCALCHVCFRLCYSRFGLCVILVIWLLCLWTNFALSLHVNYSHYSNQYRHTGGLHFRVQYHRNYRTNQRIKQWIAQAFKQMVVHFLSVFFLSFILFALVTVLGHILCAWKTWNKRKNVAHLISIWSHTVHLTRQIISV